VGEVELSATRREILASLLGLPIAASCRSRRAREVAWEGGFVERAIEDGHRLREAHCPEPPANALTNEIPILILGAGISGLSAGWQLMHSGCERFEILELEDGAGGTSIAGRSAVTAYPWGAHYLPAPRARNEDLVRLLEETGTVVGRDESGEPIYSETELCASPKERIFHLGLWYPGLYPRAGASAADLEQRARFEEEIARLIDRQGEDGRRAFAVPLASSSKDPALLAEDGMSMADWMNARRFDSPRLRWYAEYATRDDFGTKLEDASAWYALHYFCARTERSSDESAEFLTWPEGNGFLVEHLARRIGAQRIKLGRLVTSIGRTPDGRRARVVVFDRGTKTVSAYVADRVICALPSFLRAHLLPEAQPYAPRYAPWLVANVHLASIPASNGAPIAWDNVMYESRSLGYVVATHQALGRPSKTVWTYYLPLVGSDERAERRALLSLSYREACDAIVEDLSRGHIDLAERIERIDVMRWGHGMARPSPGTAVLKERAQAWAPLGPIHFAHTDLSGVALFEEAFFHGVRAAREAVAALRCLSNQAR
jgi:glycine/D-amino acid oxidase-like deaminating enzyme